MSRTLARTTAPGILAIAVLVAALHLDVSGELAGVRGRRLLTASSGYVDGERLERQWDQTYVYLSLLVAWFGSYVGFATSTARHTLQVDNVWWKFVMVAQAGLSWGFCTIWSVYFVGMHALVLHGDSSSRGTERVPVMFDPSMTVISGFLAWFMAGIGVFLLMKHRQSDNMSLISLRAVARIAASSAAATLGVIGMHAIGYLSQTGPFTMDINVGILVVCAIVASIVAAVGICIVGIRPNNTLLRCLGAVFTGGAMNGLVFVSLTASSYSVKLSDRDDNSNGWDLPSRDLAVVSFIIDLLLLSASNYYTERMQQFVTGKAEELEKLLRYQNYVKGSKKLIRRVKAMRFPMSLLPFDIFVKYGKLIPHESLRDKGKLIYVDSPGRARKVRQKGLIIFFSHQWLSHDHPDPTNCQYQDMVLATRFLMKSTRVKTADVFIWVDYSSVPQEAMDQQQLAIESLPTYVSSCSAFIIIAPQVMHANNSIPCNFTTYSDRLWCRLEVFCMILATMKIMRSKDPVDAVKEEPSMVDDDGESPHISLGKDLNAGNKQVFIWLSETLHAMKFWNSEGKMQPCYESLLYLYEGNATCCDKGHPKREGEDILCDKLRLVTTLTGIYGLMLVEMHKSQQSKSVGSNEYAASRAFAAEIVRLRSRIFPEEFFETRMEAMHQQVEQWKKTLLDLGVDENNDGGDRHEEAEEVLGTTEGSQTGTEEASETESEGSPIISAKPHNDRSPQIQHSDAVGAQIASVDSEHVTFELGIADPGDTGAGVGKQALFGATLSIVPTPAPPTRAARVAPAPRPILKYTNSKHTL